MSSINSLTDFTEPTAPYQSNQFDIPDSRSTSVSSGNINLRRKLTSNIWQYCIPKQANEPLLNTNGKPIWKCQACLEKRKKSTEFLVSGGTNTIMKHLKREHGIVVEVLGEERRMEHTKRMEDIRNFTTGESPLKRRKLTTEEHTLDEAVLRELYCQYIVEENLAIAHCQSLPFRDFLQYINTAANDLLPSSPTTIKADLERSYSTRKLMIKQALQSAISSIHLTPDGWTSPNHLGLLGVVAHFISEDKGLQHIVIGLKELDGPHTDANMAGVLYDIIQDYGITTETGYIMADNATSNDTMMTRLSEYLRQDGIAYDPDLRRLRCNGHVINLTVIAFFFGKHPFAKDKDYDRPALDDLEEWRSYGPFGKLYNIVVYTQESPQRRAEFRKLTDGLNLRRDQKTRWNSWFIMIEWATEPLIKSAIQSFCAEESNLQDDLLLFHDWKILADIREFLRAFYDATKATESSQHSVARVIPTANIPRVPPFFFSFRGVPLFDCISGEYPPLKNTLCAV